jgi:ubiquinol-cytochrome c reductase cytochrome b subunit
VHDPKHAPDTTFWPDQVLKDAVACLAVLATVLILAVLRPAELSAPADPAVKFDAARPEWYFLFLFRFLRFHAVEALGLTFGAIIVPGVIMGIIAVMPLTERLLGRFGHLVNKGFMWLLALGVLALTVLAFYEDANDRGHQAALAEAHRDAGRAIELAKGPDKIPVEGAVTLLRQDPFTQGPRLFAQHCASCHRWNGHDGRGSLITDALQPGQSGAPPMTPPTAADLGNFGSREWMRAIVLDYSNHFRWLKNAGWYAEARQKTAAGESVDFVDPDGSEMANWTADNTESLKSAENADNVTALVEFLAAEAGHAQTQYDAALVQKGRGLATEGSWAGALSGTSCASCHETIGQDFPTAPDDSSASGYPIMAKYGSAAWLKDFIRNPGAARHYGAKNRMPAYAPQQLSDTDLDLLVRWMTKSYAASTVPDYPSQLEALNAAMGGSTTAAPAAADKSEAKTDETAPKAEEPKA